MSGYATIREHLGGLIGKRLVEVTQHDESDWEERRESFVCLMFEDGSSVKFNTCEDAFELDGPIADTGEAEA